MILSKRILPFALLVTLTSVTSLVARADSSLHRSQVRQGPVTLSVSVDKVVAQVVDPVQLVLEVTAPQGTHVEMPRLPEKLGDFEVRDSETLRDIPRAENANDRLWILKATLETIKTGSVEIPSLDVHFSTLENATVFETVQSQPIEIQITSVLEDRSDPTKFRDIKDVVDVAVPEESSNAWVVWTVAGVSIAAAVALAAVLLTRRNRGPTPAAWALAQIEDLQQLLSDSSADPELTYNELVNVVREFFEYEYNVPTLTRTSHEFLLEAAKTVQLGDTPRQRLASLMAVADDIKFACHGVDNQQLQQAFEDVKAFVLECEVHREALEREDA
ncbi:hypothetical protein [Bythopirellula polymerisocia]|uniref:Protein BatD n=1 Tax=Bythopirellula polymerisocia TaxID=2528003 RepID=A0A5C6CLT7_9BACT|nr:hypothetical protein [Bythopirellula polymerisocia]TWU25863.1 hypothetical protein Pla144_30760 [Bythopirellula polymerisocia]